jgi:hypothetical protein
VQNLLAAPSTTPLSKFYIDPEMFAHYAYWVSNATLQQEIELSRLRHDTELKEKERLARIKNNKVSTQFCLYLI